jgi:hypothetical protein
MNELPRGPKSRPTTQAAEGVPRTLSTRVHRAPRPDGYASVADAAPTVLVQSAIVPSLTLKLADLPVE